MPHKDNDDEILTSVWVDGEHHIDTWRSSAGDIVMEMTGPAGPTGHALTMPRPLRRSQLARRWCRATLTKRWLGLS